MDDLPGKTIEGVVQIKHPFGIFVDFYDASGACPESLWHTDAIEYFLIGLSDYARTKISDESTIDSLLKVTKKNNR